MGWKHELGAQIKQARESLKMSQAQLAARLRVSRQMISRYEMGHDVPAVEILARAAEILGTEFRVKGFLITFEQTGARSLPRPLIKQLQLPFEKPRRFRGAMVEITPQKGRILIRAEIPA